MARLDPRALRPADLVRLLNATPLGEVVRSHHVHAQQNRAGYRIGDGRRIDLVRYVAWLCAERREMKRLRAKGGYETHRARAGARQRRQSEEARDIGDLPAVKDPIRRAEGLARFQRFCEIYFPETFYLPWSGDQLHVMARIEQAVLRGGLFGLAMPRGSGKTSLCEAGCLWAIALGVRRFVVLVAAAKDLADKILQSIKRELEQNELLAEDFPELCYPVRRLEGIANRCKGQLCHGRRTHIEWTAKHVVLATLPADVLKEAGVPEANGIGAIIMVRGITGSIFGLKHKRPDGTAVRPDMVDVDDPQTPQSAASVVQCERREEILAGAILGLAGPGRKIAGFMPCTVIHDGDMADRILNRTIHPEWQGERFKIVYAFPINKALWEEYAELRAASLRDGGQGEEATEFYRQHRAEMDEGAIVAWPERYEPGEISALQSAINIKLRDERVFACQYQNEPLPDETDAVESLKSDQICAKANNRPRGEVPAGADVLTAFIDVQERLLYYAVCVWKPDFTGHVVDYGTYPDQRRAEFNARKAPRTLRMSHPGTGLEGSIYAGLEALVDNLVGREWRQEGGAVLRLNLLLIDANWGQVTETVHQFCRESAHAAVLMPSRGQGIGAANKPISEYDRKRGDRIGHHWWVPSMKGKRRVLRHLEIDTNYWKSFIHERLATAPGDRGCLSLFGQQDRVYRHRMFAEHLTAEYCVRTAGRGRTVDEWKLLASKPDNHWFDCLVGCAAGASMRGIVLATAAGVKLGGPPGDLRWKRKRKRVHYLAI